MSPIQAFPWLQIGMVISKMLTFISPINSCISSHRESWKKMTKICMNPFEFSTLSVTGEKSWRHFSIEWNPIFSLQCAFSFQQCLLPPLKTYHVGFAPAQQLSQWEWRSKEGGGNTGYWKVQILFFIASPIKDNPGWLQKLLSFRYQKPNQIPIVGTVSNPEFEPNQISATLNQSRMRTGQASILVKVIKMSKY